MKKHFVESNSILLAYTACGVHRAILDPKAETKRKANVTCGNCKKSLKARAK